MIMMEKLVNFKNYIHTKVLRKEKLNQQRNIFSCIFMASSKTKLMRMEALSKLHCLAFQCLLVQQSVKKSQLIFRKKVKMFLTCKSLRDNYEFS